MSKNYVLITAARNEEAYIGKTIEAVLSQTILPKRWVIVSDGSTDRTDEITREAAGRHGFIRFVRKEMQENQAGFASKVHALALGWGSVAETDCEFIGHLDADVSFEPFYYEKVLEKFIQSPVLGIAGGLIHEEDGGRFRGRPSNSERSVAGAIQVFRRQCYEEIDGLKPLTLGGEDWCAEIMARMNGWEVQAFPELIVLHHKKSASARGALRESYRQGLVDYSLGSHPFFELAKCFRRLRERPYVIAAVVRIVGFTGASLRRQGISVSNEIREHLRREQKSRMNLPVGKVKF